MTRQIRLVLPWARPPLSANDRLHWMERRRLTAEIRTTTAWLARAAGIPRCQHISVTLVWAPGDHRRRDVDNAVPTLKAACDGLVAAAVTPDDTPVWMTKQMPVILPPPEPPGLWLTIITNSQETRP